MMHTAAPFWGDLGRVTALQPLPVKSSIFCQNLLRRSRKKLRPEEDATD